MNSFFRGLIFAVAALAAGFVAVLIGLAIAFAVLSSQTSGLMAISLHFSSPIGALVLAFLLLAFFGGFSYGARHHRVQTR
jgi:fumarate reductase subunit D